MGKADGIVGPTGFAKEPLLTVRMSRSRFVRAISLTTPRATVASGESPSGIAFSEISPVPCLSRRFRSEEAGSHTVSSIYRAPQSLVHDGCLLQMREYVQDRE